MIKITLFAFGTLSEKGFRDMANEYKKRLGNSFQEIEIKETKLSQQPSDSEIHKALEEEADRLLPLLAKKNSVVALCVEGSQSTSPELASFLEGEANRGVSEICFIIGSSYGLSDRVKAIATKKLSLSKLTMPHQLARVVLMEALYRSIEIQKGSKYHK